MNKENEDFTGVVLKPEPVVAVTVTCNLGGERQLNLAAHFERDAEPDEQNRILDQVMKIADRQKARYDLEKLEESFQIVGLNTRNAVLALNSADIALKSQVERMKAELEGKREARAEVFNKAYADHTDAGRKGTFTPKGFVAANLTRMDADIQKTLDAIEAAPKDAEQEKGKIVASIQRNQEDLRLRRKQVNDLRLLAGLLANTEFEDAENAKV